MADPKALKEQLNTTVFFASNERCVCVISVQDLTKKRRDDRMVYLSATIAFSGDPHPVLYMLKKSEKSGFKKKGFSWLREIKKIDGRGDDPLRFDIESEKIWSYACQNPIDKHNFLLALYKLSNHYLRNSKEKPKFINLRIPEELLAIRDTQAAHESMFDEDRSYQAVTAEEEEKLLSLMHEWNFSVRDAEKFMGAMIEKLSELDTANVVAIIRAEEDALSMMNKLDSVIEELTDIENRLSSFENRLDSVSEAVQIMSAKDTLIQLEHANRQKLRDLLELIVSSMDVSPEVLATLEKADFTSQESISSCMDAANMVLNAVNLTLPDKMEVTVTAIKQKKQELEYVCSSFSNRVHNYLSSLIIFQAGKQNDRFHPNDVVLPNHNDLFSSLVTYAELALWLRKSNFNLFLQIVKIFKVSVAPIYHTEITGFIENARNAAAKSNVFEKRATSSVVSIDNLLSKLDKSPANSTIDIFSLQNTSKEFRQRSSKIIDKVLSQIEARVISQQEFFQTFFGSIDSDAAAPEEEVVGSEEQHKSSFSQQPDEVEVNYSENFQESESQSFTSGGSNRSRNYEDIKKIRTKTLLNEIFDGIGETIQGLVVFMIKQEPFNCPYIFVRLSEHTVRVQNKGAFLVKLIAGLLITVKRYLDQYVKELCDAMSSFKVHRGKRIGILPYVDFFQDFVAEAEEVFESSQRHSDLDRIYKTLVASIFQNIDECAFESTKVPPDLVRIENYHKVHHILRTHKIASLEPERKRAEELYQKYKSSFINDYFGQPFERLYLFFGRIDQRLQNGVKPDDIQYQSDLSVVELKKLIRDHPWSEVKKGLENLYKRVEKQISNNSSLLQVIWHGIQELFVNQYKHYVSLIKICYPNSNVMLDFTESDIWKYFTELSQQFVGF